ncbi:unnamed protein product [Rhizoctonia solani]|uniref:Zn(2)-C6 fungal-type domain-containing protein n=1 Tax=Rhizoctonia solani TaxID=456999 RepID=A0A8H2X2C1_9AGAM|nr:unnamed protein product [Rhizoctonia solani]
MEPTPPTGVRMLTRFEACLVCRRRKLRCDATQPECNRCRATGNKCQYQDPALRSRTRVLQDQIKEIEAKINEIEQRRGRSSVTSRASSSSSQNESNSSSGTLFPRSLPQVASPIAPLDDLAHQASEFSLYLGSDNSFQPNMLSQLGPSDLSLPGETSRKLLNMFLQRKQISGFELHVGRVVKSFQPRSADHGVPALYFAMLLLGCHFISEPELKLWEEMLYQRTKLEIEGNVARAYLNDRSKYNPLHHLQ